MDQPPANDQFRYSLDQWPPVAAMALLGLQWLVILVPGLLVLGELVAGALGLTPLARVAFLQRLFILCGLVQTVQVLAGHRLPAMVGPSSVLLVGVLATTGQGPGAVFGAMAVGGGLTALLGLTGLAARLRRLFTPPVLASTLILIAISLAPTIRDQLYPPLARGGSWAAPLLFALGLVAAMLWAQHRLKGLISSAVLLMGMVAGTILYHLLSLGPLPQAAPQFAQMGLLPDPIPFRLSLHPATIGAFLLCYLALISNELATVEATGEIVGAPDHKGRLNRAVLVSGAGGLLAGLTGLLGPVSYAVSPGVVLSSRSASRFTLLPTAAALLVLGFWPRALGLFTLVPSPVVGAVLFTVMASQVFASLNMLASPKRPLDWPSGAVVGSALMAGLMVSFMPTAAAQALHPTLRPLLANGFVVGLSLALVLEHLLLRRGK